jgi:hypothetical protein
VKIVRSAAEWAPVRAAGKQWFLLRYGVLGRGLPLALLTASAIQLALGTPPDQWLRTRDFFVRLGLAFIVFSLSGSLTANATWNLYERRFGAGAER